MTVGVSFAFAMMGSRAPAWVRPEQFMAFVVGQLLSIRAAVIPCTARQSIAVTAFAFMPIPVLAYTIYEERPLAGSPGSLSLAGNSLVLGAIVVVTVGIISYTVHGLRERVREALRLGQYTLTEKIGEGGMGVVYKASHALLRRPTAIKLLPPERAGEHTLARFEREVQLTSLLTHPNTVSVYDFGRTPEGTFYYAMEYLDGIDLQTLSDGDGAQDPARVIHLLAQVTGALAEAHRIEVCSHHMLTPPTPPSVRLGKPLPAELETLILKCLAKSPSERPRDAAALEAMLGACEAAGAWTKERAAAWWSERGSALRSLRPSVPVGTGTSRTLRVTRELRV